MNPRLKELAEQAGGVVLAGSEIQKFAELIVRECIEVARLTDPSDSDEYRSGRYWAGLDIKNHFGVAE